MTEISALLERASLARREGRWRDARRSLVHAAESARASESVVELVRAINGLAQIDRDEGRPFDALPRYQAALELCRERGAPGPLAHTARHLGELLVELGRLGEAEPLLTEALALHRSDESSGRLRLANALRPVALLREAQGRADDARSLWREARELYAAEGIDTGVEECDAHLGS